MSNFANLMQVFAATDGVEDPLVFRARESILAHIRGESELRFFVDGTAHYGHQAATVHMMRRLIAITGFAGRITIVYADLVDRANDDRTPYKLALLIPGLDPRNIEHAVLSYRSCREIRFLNYAQRSQLPVEIRYGFTAGADDMNINFARELKVSRLLRLQPYLWDDEASKKSDRFYTSSRIETPAEEYFYPADDYPPFRELPFQYEPCDHLDDGVWDWYAREQSFDTELRTRTAHIRARCEAGEALWPVYGMHHFHDRAGQIVANLTAAARHAAVPLVLSAPDGPLPGDVYLYLFANSRLPAVFEGQNTASLMISLGRPFLQLQRETSGLVNPYPARFAGQDFSSSASFAHAAAREIRDSSGPVPTAERFLAAAGDPSSDVSRYFAAMRRYYQQDIHDKCFAGLVALALAG